VAAQLAPAPVDTSALALRGEAEFRKVREPASNSCIACHTMQGISVGILGPNLSHVGSRTVIAGGILPNTAEGLARWLRDPPREKPGSLMPNVGLNDAEVAALVAFLQSRR
jgi:cytochrome c oxidase subunit 2